MDLYIITYFFFANRKRLAEHEGTVISRYTEQILRRVSQGSLLGPLEFILYVNGIFEQGISGELVMYAYLFQRYINGKDIRCNIKRSHQPKRMVHQKSFIHIH